MKKGLFLLGLGAAAAVAGTVTYLYQTDKDVREEVDNAVASVRELCGVVLERIQQQKAVQQASYEDQVRRTQSWADEQWDAIGI